MISRRDFLGMALAAGAASLLPLNAHAATGKVVVIGGGVGGATFAKYMKMKAPQIEVTIIEQNPIYIRPYGSSEVLNGHIDMSDLEVSYDALRNKYGVNVIIDKAVGLDADKRIVTTASGAKFPYDRLVVSPGIELLYDRLDGYSREVAETKAPSGWIPGSQTALLRDQIKNMRQGGTFLIVAPPNPYRCPPGPYERGALVAEWMQKYNPTGKVIITDPKNEFVTGPDMRLGWNRMYGYNVPDDLKSGMPTLKQHNEAGMIDWIREVDGGRPLSIDATKMQVETEQGFIKADVINVVPPMKAGKVATLFGLTDKSGWCPVDPYTFESKLVANVHVLGDSASASPLPKSGFAANNEAKVAAYAIINLFAGRPVEEPSWENTCYALAGKDYGFMVIGVYGMRDGKIANLPRPGFQTLDVSDAKHRLAAVYQQAWMKSFTEDSFA